MCQCNLAMTAPLFYYIFTIDVLYIFLYGTASAFINKNLTGTSGLSLIFQLGRESKKVAGRQNFVV